MAATGPSSPQTTKETAVVQEAKVAAVESPQCPTTEEAAAIPVAAAAAAVAPSTASAKAATAPMPTYQQTKQSKAYTLAKDLLQEGSLDDALSTLELTLQCTLQSLSNTTANVDNVDSKNKANDEDDDAAGAELHESLAPLYYLYGTTLLYSVEESDVMMGGKNGARQEDQQVDFDNEDGQQDGTNDDNNNDNNGNNDERQGEEGDDDGAAANPDTDGDLQIAWENLDTARAILSRMISEDEIQSILQSASCSDEKIGASSDNTIVLKSNHKCDAEDDATTKRQYTPEELKELVVDLARIHTRLGDLQRANGNDLDAIPDYERALELRTCLGKFDRSVADSHFGLASTYAESINLDHNNDASMNGGEGSSAKKGLTKEEVGQFREKSLDHYLACGVAFAGLIAMLCGEDPEKVTSVEAGAAGTVAAAAASATNTSTSSIHSETLAILRERVSSLQPIKNEDNDKLSDLKEMLDEIQEAMDANEDTEQALKDVAVMKANEIKKHAGKGGADGEERDEKEEEGGVTTTIGFGPPTVSAFATNALPPAASAPVAQMMVVKKKKKKPQQTQEDASAKRAKTE